MTESAGPPEPIAASTQTRVSSWNIANALTALRLAMVPVFGWLLLVEPTQNRRLWATAVFVVAAVTDRLDGQLARSRGLVTNLGKLADPIADKALIGTALVGLSLLGQLPWWVTGVVVVREVGVTVLRFVVIKHGVIAASRGGKLKTALQVVAITMFLLPWGGLWHAAAVLVMGAAVIVTTITGLDYVRQAWRMSRTSGLGQG